MAARDRPSRKTVAAAAVPRVVLDFTWRMMSWRLGEEGKVRSVRERQWLAGSGFRVQRRAAASGRHFGTSGGTATPTETVKEASISDVDSAGRFRRGFQQKKMVK